MDQLVPLNSVPNQSLIVPLNIDGSVQNFVLTLRYNEIAAYWALTLQDNNGKVLLDSIPFITGDAISGNILGQFAYLKAGRAFIINASSTALMEYPNSFNLGRDFVLVWGDTPRA